jgi:N-acetyl-anhydromuramyl-L-alanine amidase AmpD
MAGTLAATDGWFTNPASQVSAHYGVGLDGRIHRYVEPENRAWANGVLEPGNKWPGLAGVNPNDLTLSIETEDRGAAAQPVTDAQYASVRDLGLMLVALYPSVKWLLRHTDISPHTRPGCPGNRWVGSGRFGELAAELGLLLT